MNYEASCILGAFFSFVLFVIMCYRIHLTTKEIEKAERELSDIES